MICPYCSHEETKVVDKRDSEETTRRRRECLKCEKRFTTYERPNIDIDVIKKDGRREPFEREKLKKGLLRAFEKRKITQDQIDSMLANIEQSIRNHESTEIKSHVIGEMVMQKLKDVDPVAYIRFASVYREFRDINSFDKEIKMLKKES